MKRKSKIFNLKFKKGFIQNHSNRLGLGFTLVEMLVVIAIIGILATIITVSYANAKGKSNYSKTLSDMNTVAKALSLYNSEYGTYPAEFGSIVPSGDTRITKYISTLPAAVCKNYVYYYVNGVNGAGLYYKYTFLTNISRTTPVYYNQNIFYLGINNFTSSQYDNGGVSVGAPTTPDGKLINPISIGDVPNKSYNCNVYKTGY